LTFFLYENPLLETLYLADKQYKGNNNDPFTIVPGNALGKGSAIF
jgi:hypothetical protein